VFNSISLSKYLEKGDDLHQVKKKTIEGWIKLNSDGACKRCGESTGCGGLFRNSDGRWIKDYFKKISVCDDFHAELWKIYLGLNLT
jgi:hypothetical protein